MRKFTYVKDRKLVDIGTIRGQQLEVTKKLVQIKYDK